MTSLEILRLRLVKSNLSLMARESGVSLQTLYRTRDGLTTPNLATFEKMVGWLNNGEAVVRLDAVK